MIKLLQGWRTIIFNLITTALAIAAMPEVLNVLPANVLPWVLLANALGNMYLRSITTTPIGKKY